MLRNKYQYLYLRDPQKIIFLPYILGEGIFHIYWIHFIIFFVAVTVASWIMTWHEERIHKQPLFIKVCYETILDKTFQLQQYFFANVINVSIKRLFTVKFQMKTFFTLNPNLGGLFRGSFWGGGRGGGVKLPSLSKTC